MTPRHIAHRLLVLQAKQDEWFDSVNSIDGVEIQDPIGGDWLLIDVVCDVLDYPSDDDDIDDDGHTWSREMMGNVWFELRNTFFQIPLFLDIVERKRQMPLSYGSNSGTLLDYLLGTEDYRAERDAISRQSIGGEE